MLTANAEYAPSQYELVYRHDEGMAGLDNGFTFKNGVKEIVQHAGYTATFMGKPSASSAGSGCHYHISLLDRESGQSAFYDPDNPNDMTPTLRHFVQGLIDHGAACTALFNPTPNLLPPAHTPHLRAVQCELGGRGPERDGTHQAAGLAGDARGDAGVVGHQQSLPLRRRHARLRAARAQRSSARWSRSPTGPARTTRACRPSRPISRPRSPRSKPTRRWWSCSARSS